MPFRPLHVTAPSSSSQTSTVYTSGSSSSTSSTESRTRKRISTTGRWNMNSGNDNKDSNNNNDDNNNDLAWPLWPFQSQPPTSSPMTASASNTTLIAPSDEERDSRHRRLLHTTTNNHDPFHDPQHNFSSSSGTTPRKKSGVPSFGESTRFRAPSTIKMVVKTKPTTATTSTMMTTTAAAPTTSTSQQSPPRLEGQRQEKHEELWYQPGQFPHRPSGNRLQAHLSKTTERTAVGTSLGQQITTRNLTEAVSGIDPEPTIVSTTSTFLSPLTTDLPETEDDHRFRIINPDRSPPRLSSSSNSFDGTNSHSPLSHGREDAYRPPDPPSPTTTASQPSTKEEPPGLCQDDTLWYPSEEHTTTQPQNEADDRPVPDNYRSDGLEGYPQEPTLNNKSSMSPPRIRFSTVVHTSSSTREADRTAMVVETATIDQDQPYRPVDTYDKFLRPNRRRFDDPMDAATASWEEDNDVDNHGDKDGLYHQSPHRAPPLQKLPNDSLETSSTGNPYAPDPPQTRPLILTTALDDEVQAIEALSPTAQEYYFYKPTHGHPDNRTTSPPTLESPEISRPTVAADPTIRYPPMIPQDGTGSQDYEDLDRSSSFDASSSFQAVGAYRRSFPFQTPMSMSRLDEEEEEEEDPHPPPVETDSIDYPLPTTPSRYSLPSRNLYSSTLYQDYPMQRQWSAPVPAPRATAATTTSAMETASNYAFMRKTKSFDVDSTTDMHGQPPSLLSWRMDPTESLSDWKVQAFDRSSKQFTTYHVHKVVLCVGSRACGYFVRQLQQQQKVKDPNLASPPPVQLPLIRKAFELLPEVLDFCYATPNWQVTRATAVGLVFLGTLLDQPQLKAMAMEFVYKDLSPDSKARDDDEDDEEVRGLVGSVLHHYLAEAGYFDQDALAEYLLELTANHLLDMDSPSQILAELSPSQFLAVLRQIPKRSSSHLSTVVVDYCIFHRLELTLPFVETCACLCPIFTTDAALALLELYLTLGGGSEDGYHYHGHSDGDTKNSGIGLLHRCLEVLAGDSAALLAQPETLPQLVNQILNVCPPLLGTWIRDMLQETQKQGTLSEADMRNAWEEHAVLRDELAATKRALDQAEAERLQLQKTLESTKQEFRQQLDGWMGKSHRDTTEHSTRQAIWQEERDLWRIERQTWMEERGALEHELYRLKAQVAHQREMNGQSRRHRRKRAARNRGDIDNTCEQVQSQGIFKYLSNVGIPLNGEASVEFYDEDYSSSSSSEYDRVGFSS